MRKMQFVYWVVPYYKLFQVCFLWTYICSLVLSLEDTLTSLHHSRELKLIYIISFMVFDNRAFTNMVAVDSHSPYGQRTTVICCKDHSTPQKYPREAGTPSKLPL